MDYIDKLIQSCESYMIHDDDLATESAIGLAAGLIAISVLSGSFALAVKKLNSPEFVNKVKTQMEQKAQGTKSTPKISTEVGKKLLSNAYSDIGKIVKEYQKNPEIKSRIKSLIDNFTKESADDGYPISKSDLQYKLICDIFEESDEELVIEIIDGSQEINNVLSPVISDIAKAIRIKYPQLKVSTGDGDEGCIYLSY